MIHGNRNREQMRSNEKGIDFEGKRRPKCVLVRQGKGLDGKGRGRGRSCQREIKKDKEVEKESE